MTLLLQLPCAHSWKPFIFFCIIVSLSFYHFHGLPTSPNPTGDLDAPYLSFGSLSSTSGHKHPVELLVEHARRRFTRMVESQSKSLEQAIANYKKRYNREPPPGFDEWYRVAVELNATIIDDYDTVMTSLEPYWGISARELRARVREVISPEHCNGLMMGIAVKDHQILTLTNDKLYTGMRCSTTHFKMFVTHFICRLSFRCTQR